MEWQEAIVEPLAAARTLVVLGVGNEMMADDAAGVLAARGLKKIIQNQKSEIKITILEAGTTPENFTGVIRQARPDAVLLIDAADMGLEVGAVALLEPKDMHSMMHSTHTMPLSFLAGYIERISPSRVLALGIQAGRIDLDAPMSRAVARSVKDIVKNLGEILCGRRSQK